MHQPSLSQSIEYRAAGGAERCAALLELVETMPRETWLAVGRRELADDAVHAARKAAAGAALDAVIAERRLGVTAWLLRDAVETAVEIAGAGGAPTAERHRQAKRPFSAEEQRALAAAHRAAERAVLACLLRRWLSREDLALLASSFVAAAGAGSA